jgi:hypothetical protein
MISPRYAAPVVALLALALVPTVIHSYRGVRVDDGLEAAAIAGTLQGMSSSPTARRAGWVRSNFDTDDWIERTYKENRIDVTLFVARSYDPKRLYHHPELAILRGTQTTPAGISRTTARPDIPIHVLGTEQNGRHGIAVYALLYDDRFIDNPILFQLRTSLQLLVSGRRPLTLFMTSAFAGNRDKVEESPATRLLLAAIEDFERQPGGRSGR